MDSLPMRAADDSPGATANSVKSDDSSPCHDPGRGSPPPNCAICLGTCRNKSFTDSCLHQFCFKCLLTWSKVKAECPLCKQNFKSIIHNVRSNHQYEEYMVEQRHTEELSERIDIDNVTTTRRFRYRTTLTLPRQNSLALQQLLLHHYPMVAELFPGPPAPRRRSPASFRRTVYRYNLWARPLPDFTHRFRDCSPDFYRHNTSQMHRLVPWLNRELHYLLNENVGHIAYVVARILELLPQHSINSTEFRDAMRRYFGENTEHFLHELYCFASTPYDMNGYDRHVQYTTDSTISTVVNSVVSSSESDASADSDIVVVSSSAPAPAPREPPAGPSRPLRAAPAYPQSYITQPADGVIPIETVSHSDTDDDSSEVMVVGYIKPPQDRTPEVVDLLGSDSDVFVQEPPEPSDPPSLVKLTLARRDAAAAAAASASDGGRTPSRSPPPRRARRPAPSPASTASAASAASTTTAATAASRSASSDFPYRSSPSDSEEDADSRARRPERRRKKAKKRARKLAPREKESIASPAKRTKYKSYSGKGVKSSKKCAAGEDDAAPTETESGRPLDQPGTSGMSRDRSCLTIGVHGIGRGSGMPRRRERSRDSSDLCGPSGTSRVPCTCTGGISAGTSDISRGTSDESRGTSDISRFTSETSRDKSNYLTNGANVSVPGTSGIPRGRSERSRGSTDVLCGPSGISHVASDTSHSTGGVSRGTSDESRAASEVSWGTSDVSRGTSGTSRSTSEISQSTSEMSRGTRDLSRGKSEMTRGTSKVSRGKSEVSRGTRETSRGTSDVSSGTSEISRGTSHVSSGTSEISRGTSTSCGTKRKLERGTRRHESRRESKRLKSVVNVVNSQNNSAREPAGGRQSSESESEYEPPASAGARSDSDDDLPLNLSLMKRSR